VRPAVSSILAKAFDVAPTDISLSSSTEAENQTVPTLIGTFSTTDSDVGDVFTYTFATGSGDTDNGSFTIVGNSLSAIAAFDFETKTSYSIRIRSTDLTLMWVEKTFTINVTNVNEPPTDITLSANSVLENLASGTTVGSLSSTDPDLGTTFTYSLVSGAGSTDNGSFNLSGNLLQTAAIFDFETKDSYTVRIRTSDGSLHYEEVFAISVTNVNEAPVAASVNYTVDGRIGVLHTGSFSYTDPEGDAQGTHLYKWYLSANSSGTGAVAISGATSLTYRPVISDGGKYLAFEITPVDVIGLSGTPVRSAFRLVNSAPVATNVNVYAPSAVPGQTIRGRFTYSDDESNPRGNALYTWYRKNTATINPNSPGTAIGSDSTYVLKAADAGKYIWFKVKPVATAGSTPGDSVWSNIIGPIGDFSASIAGTASFCAGTTMSITLTVSGGVSPYRATLGRTGFLPKDTVINNITTSPYTVQVKVPGTYTLKTLSDASTPTAENATISGDPVILTLYTKPSAVLTGTQGLCNDGISTAPLNLNLSGTAPWTFKIRRGSSSANDTIYTGILADPFTINARIIGASPTPYRMVSISDSHCTGDTANSGTARVYYLPSPTALISGTDTICPGETGTLQVDLTGTGPWSITYLRNGANPTIVSNITTLSYALSVTGGGTYTLSRVEDSQCTGKVSGTGKIVQYTVPTATLTGTATICEHTNASLNVALTGTSPWKYSYRLNGGTPTEVVNVLTSPNSIQANLAGTYTMFEVYDKYCKGTVSGNAIITVTQAPNVTISGLLPAYNKTSTDWVPISGTPTGGTFTGPGVVQYGGWFFLPFLPAVGTHNIVYAYQTSPTSCWGYDTAVVRVMMANGIIEFPEGRTKYCQNDAPFVVHGVNLVNAIGTFSINGGAVLVDHHDNTATITPSQLGVKEYTITYSYFDGTQLSVTATFEVGKPPVANFQWKTECYEPGQSIAFTNTSSSTFGNITSSFWKIYKSTGYDTTSHTDIVYTFQAPDNHSIDLRVGTSYGCFKDTSKVFTLRPTIPLAGVTYFEDFEEDPVSWQSTKMQSTPTNSWTFGSPTLGFSNMPGSEKCWYTYIPYTNGPREQSWVSSPCFDFTGTSRPMLKMNIYRLFNALRDGATLQATADSGKTWNIIGQLADGINWFNEYTILGNPGGQQIGWSNVRDGGWIESRHSLDKLKNKARVQFRIAYGSDGTARNTQGIAFDNFWIGQRDRATLLEHFTNSSDALSGHADSLVNALVTGDSLNIVDLQFHTSFPGEDPFNETEPYSPNLRVLYYGLSDVPVTIMNGGYKAGSRFDFDDAQLDTTAIRVESLYDSKFDINHIFTLEQSQLTIETIIAAQQALPAKELTVHVTVIEQEVDGYEGNNGETFFRSVVKTMLPDASGTTLFKSWTEGEQRSIVNTWNMTDVIDANQLRIVSFIQDESTHEVYQVAKDVIGLANGLDDPPVVGNDGGFVVYPNPARDKSYILFTEESGKEATVMIYNNLGSVVASARMARGVNRTELPTGNLPAGVYMIRAFSGNELLGVRKLSLTR
jgi:hypothetical protein